jgi:hypothetical protein
MVLGEVIQCILADLKIFGKNADSIFCVSSIKTETDSFFETFAYI